MDILEELKDFVAEEEAKELEIDITNPNMIILNDEQANFMLRRIDELTKEKNEVTNSCDKEIENFCNKVNKFRADKERVINTTVSYLSNLLKNYAISKLEGGKAKTYKLAFGNLSFKKKVDKYIYEEDKVAESLKNMNLDYIKREEKIVEKIDKKKIKQNAVIIDNQVYLNNVKVEGITVEKGEDEFIISNK